MEDYGKGFEEGLNLYDTEKIVSSIYSDSYKCYDFDSVYTIAFIIKDKYGLFKDINDYELTGDTLALEKKYGKDTIDDLCAMCDSCICLENDMLLSFTRESKNDYAEKLNKILTEEVYDKLMAIYETKKSIKYN